MRLHVVLGETWEFNLDSRVKSRLYRASPDNDKFGVILARICSVRGKEAGIPKYIDITYDTII